MRFFGGSGGKVGAVNGRRTSLDPDVRALMRVNLPDGADAEEAVRAVLDRRPATNVVDDPLGVLHEAVPYEALVLAGRQELAESLKLSLPRFFAPLSFRRLEFEIHHVPTSGSASLLFGNLLETGLGAESGLVQVLHENRTLEPTLPGPAGTSARLCGGQGRAVVALGRGPASDGLWSVDLDAPTQAFVITPGRDGPHVQLRRLNEPGRVGDIVPVLGPVIEEAAVAHNAEFEFYEASFRARNIVLRIVPDSAYARLAAAPRPDVDLLEIVGIFLPTPGRAREIEGLAVRFDADRRLLGHGLRSEDSRVLLVGRDERFVQRANGRHSRIGKRGVASDLGLRLQPARSVDDTAAVQWSLLAAEGGGALGWIPLRLAEPDSDDPYRTERSDLRYTRHGWVGPSDVGANGAALHLDWLNHAVRLVAGDGDGGSVCLGLAKWIAQQGARLEGELRVVRDRIVHETGDGHTTSLRDRSLFRLGPLWVRLHLASPETDS